MKDPKKKKKEDLKCLKKKEKKTINAKMAESTFIFTSHFFIVVC
jgi:hypothetical protein